MKCGESDIRNKKYQENYSEEKFFQMMIPEENPLILDVGAHFGESVEFFHSIFPEADICSVEADPESYLKLLEIFSDPKKAINAAIGAKAGIVTFYRYNISHLNSLYAINKKSKDSLGYAESCEEKKIEVLFY